MSSPEIWLAVPIVLLMTGVCFLVLILARRDTISLTIKGLGTTILIKSDDKCEQCIHKLKKGVIK